jgi:hypothetical protein
MLVCNILSVFESICDVDSGGKKERTVHNQIKKEFTMVGVSKGTSQVVQLKMYHVTEKKHTVKKYNGWLADKTSGSSDSLKLAAAQTNAALTH